MKNFKNFTLGFLTCAILLVTISFVDATGIMKNISAVQDSTIKITLNGKNFTPKDADGTLNYPIIYEGRTYLPVRSLAEAISLPVNWDSATRTVTLGAKYVENSIFVGKNQIFASSTVKPMIYSEDSASLNIFSYPTSYTSGLTCVAGDAEWYAIGINTEGYKYLTGEANLIDPDNHDNPPPFDVYNIDPVTNKKAEVIGKIMPSVYKPTSFKIDVSGSSKIVILFWAKKQSKEVLGNLKLEK